MKTATVIILCLFLSGCADAVNLRTSFESVGFVHGFWHGIILPFSWLWSLLDETTAIYAVYNSGGWYDFGFISGIILFVGSSR